MTAANLDLVIEQSATWTLALEVTQAGGTAKDLTNYTPKMQFRKSAADQEVLFDFSIGNGRLTKDGTLGLVTATLTDQETGSITWSEAVYDLIIDGPDVLRVVEGKVTVKPGVTR